MADDIKLANPAVLGLTCFGLTTMLLNLHNAGVFKMDSTILGMGFFVGGLAQVIAGTMEFRKGNTFATTAFLAYGTFWMSLAFAVIVKPIWLTKIGLEVSGKGLAWYLLLWGIFTMFMFIGTLRINRLLQFVFLTLVVLFVLLAIGIGWQNTTIIKAGGIVGLFTGAAALYLAMAENLEEIYGKVVLPYWPYSESKNYKHPEDL
jgi:succinate-acetate transporter protein